VHLCTCMTNLSVYPPFCPLILLCWHSAIWLVLPHSSGMQWS